MLILCPPSPGYLPPASPSSGMKAYAESHPLRFAILVTIILALLVCLMGILIPKPADDYPLAVLAYDGLRYGLAIGLLAILGC